MIIICYLNTIENPVIRYKITKQHKVVKKCYFISEGAITMIRILLSKKLGEIRWTQADLSRVTGIRPNTISELYHEMVERVTLEHLDLICEALNCNLDELIVREPNDLPKINHTKNGTMISSK